MDLHVAPDDAGCGTAGKGALMGLKFYILDEDRNVRATEDFATWSAWKAEHTDLYVDVTHFRTPSSEVSVSTVSVGLGVNGPFKTMVLGGPESGLCMHYQTWAAAEAGHRKIVAALKARNPGTEAGSGLGSGSAVTAARPDLVLGSRIVQGYAGG